MNPTSCPLLFSIKIYKKDYYSDIIQMKEDAAGKVEEKNSSICDIKPEYTNRKRRNGNESTNRCLDV